MSDKFEFIDVEYAAYQGSDQQYVPLIVKICIWMEVSRFSIYSCRDTGAFQDNTAIAERVWAQVPPCGIMAGNNADQRRIKMKRLAIAGTVLGSALLAVGTPALASTSHGLKQVRDPSRVTGTITGHCSYRDKGQLPDPRCTPGSIDPIVTQSNIKSTICKSGWTDPHLRPPESQTERFKYDVAYPHYGTPQSEKTELDHLVPLELGGSNDATNLWPEYPPSPNPKDKVEDALNAAVCERRVSLAAAQKAIANWLTAEKALGIGKTARRSTGSTSPKPWCKASAAPANDGWAGDYNVYVTSNQPDRDATASDAGDTWAHDTNSSGATTVYLWYTSPGMTIKVTVGGASCSTSA